MWQCRDSCYEERLAVGLPGRHEVTRTKVILSILSTTAVDMAGIGFEHLE